MNCVLLTGRIGSDPELRTLPSGTQITEMRVAVNDNYKNKNGEKVERTHWFTVKAFGKLADLASTYLSRGNKVGIIGRFNYEEWETEGHRRSKVTIIAHKLEFMSSKAVKTEDPEKEPF